MSPTGLTTCPCGREGDRAMPSVPRPQPRLVKGKAKQQKGERKGDRLGLPSLEALERKA